MKNIFDLLKFYYQLAGRRLIIFTMLACGAVAFDAMTITLFLPIVQGDNSASKIVLIVKEIFKFVGLQYSLATLLAVLVSLFTFKAIFLIGQGTFASKIMCRLLVELRTQMVEKAFAIDYQGFLSKSSGYLNNAIIVEFQKVVFCFRMFSMLLVSILFSVMYVTFPLIMNPILMLCVIIAFVPIYFVMKKINSLTKKYSVLTTKHSSNLQRFLLQALGYFKYLKATANETNVLTQVHNQSRILGNLQFRMDIFSAVTQYGFQPIGIIIIAAMIFYFSVYKGQPVIENAFVMYLFYVAFGRILSMQEYLRKSLDAWGSISIFKQLNKEFDELNEKNLHKNSITKSPSFNCPINFRDVSFHYNNGPEILKNISFTIEPNTTVAFVGASGSGKTTLANLITSLIRPTSGAIYLGDTPFTNLDLKEFRSRIGYITQESVIFNDSIFNNITMWNTNNKECIDQVTQAAHDARILEFIQQSKEGFDSILGESGINISGGQRQRICIARELFKECHLLIFDEATSSLDTDTENAIQKNIDDFRGKKTVVIIAHRLSTIKKCDRIILIKNGRIEEQGNYEELCSKNGEFSNMVRIQSLG
jgi:subfamily B ATP-binding cassette protein MsbA